MIRKTPTQFSRPVRRIASSAILVVVVATCWGQIISPGAATTARTKILALRSGFLSTSAQTVTFSEEEVNSFLALDLSTQYPGGLSKVAAQLQQDRVIGTATVDFDRLKQSSPRQLPPLAEYFLFGTHDIRVEGGLTGSGGKGRFSLQAVAMDGLPMPQFLFDAIMNYYLRRRFPDVDLDSPFTLPYSIDDLTVQPGQVRVAGPAAAAAH